MSPPNQPNPPRPDLSTVNVRMPTEEYERMQRVIEILPSSNSNNFVNKCVRACLDIIEGEGLELPRFLATCRFALSYDSEPELLIKK